MCWRLYEQRCQAIHCTRAIVTTTCHGPQTGQFWEATTPILTEVGCMVRCHYSIHISSGQIGFCSHSDIHERLKFYLLKKHNEALNPPPPPQNRAPTHHPVLSQSASGVLRIQRTPDRVSVEAPLFINTFRIQTFIDPPFISSYTVHTAMFKRDHQTRYHYRTGILIVEMKAMLLVTRLADNSVGVLFSPSLRMPEN